MYELKMQIVSYYTIKTYKIFTRRDITRTFYLEIFSRIFRNYLQISTSRVNKYALLNAVCFIEESNVVLAGN